MTEEKLILGLFFSDENNLIFDNIKFSEDLLEENVENLKILSYKFLGPLFLTAASVSVDSGENWRIEYIESSLSLQRGKIADVDIIQSFFNLNSSINYEEGTTYLSALIGSPHTEDLKMIYKKLVRYIHPSIIQGRIVQESILGGEFQFKKFIREELNRGLNLIEYSLGSSRKMYWEEQQKYYCIALIERKISNDLKSSFLYTFDKDDPFRKHLSAFIPSYYITAILPDYYDNLVKETLEAFGKKGITPNVRTIRLSAQDKHAIYLEEFITEKDTKTSYGVMLIPENELIEDAKNISFFKRNLRLILDANKDLIEITRKINPKFDFEKWGTSSDRELEEIRSCLDS
ncbi:MAG: hypothetical protein ACFFAN_05470 [Promethearchaeota archaeon]